jgi:hypothetical protein
LFDFFNFKIIECSSSCEYTVNVNKQLKNKNNNFFIRLIFVSLNYKKNILIANES